MLQCSSLFTSCDSVSPSPCGRACEGRVSTVALKVGVVFLCGGKLDDKLKCEGALCVCVCVCWCVGVPL